MGSFFSSEETEQKRLIKSQQTEIAELKQERDAYKAQSEMLIKTMAGPLINLEGMKKDLEKIPKQIKRETEKLDQRIQAESSKLGHQIQGIPKQAQGGAERESRKHEQQVQDISKKVRKNEETQVQLKVDMKQYEQELAAVRKEVSASSSRVKECESLLKHRIGWNGTIRLQDVAELAQQFDNHEPYLDGLMTSMDLSPVNKKDVKNAAQDSTFHGISKCLNFWLGQGEKTYDDLIQIVTNLGQKDIARKLRASRNNLLYNR